MTNKELEAKVINAQSAVAKREAVLAKHRVSRRINLCSLTSSRALREQRPAV